MTAPVLEVRNLRTWFDQPDGRAVRAVDGVDLKLHAGEVLALVGESGSGKSVTALSVMGLVARPGRIVEGNIRLDGEDLRRATPARLQALRGARMAMVFQQPRASLNPVQRIGDQIAEQFIRHQGLSRHAASARAIELLERVEMPDPARRARDYPHQLSGGQAQRVGIAIAVALRPALLIADEPTTALDVTVQAQLLRLMLQLCHESGTALLLVTHDLGVVAQVADRVAVMYAGRVVEQAPVTALFDQPQHPYTEGLIASLAVPGQRRERLIDIPGSVPALDQPFSACRFEPRCARRIEGSGSPCRHQEPPWVSGSTGAGTACWLRTDLSGNP